MRRSGLRRHLPPLILRIRLHLSAVRRWAATALRKISWTANGISPIAAGGAGTRRHVTSTARGWGGSSLTMMTATTCGLNPTIPIAGLLASSSSAGGLAGSAIFGPSSLGQQQPKLFWSMVAVQRCQVVSFFTLLDRYTQKEFINCTRFSHPRGRTVWSLANNTSLSCIILTRGGRHRGRRFFYGLWSTKRPGCARDLSQYISESILKRLLERTTQSPLPLPSTESANVRILEPSGFLAPASAGSAPGGSTA